MGGPDSAGPVVSRPVEPGRPCAGCDGKSAASDDAEPNCLRARGAFAGLARRAGHIPSSERRAAHPGLTVGERRAILASWASDADAVEDAP